MWCFVWLFLAVSTSAIDCLERLVSEMTYYVSSGTLNPTHSLTTVNSIFLWHIWRNVCLQLEPLYMCDWFESLECWWYNIFTPSSLADTCIFSQCKFCHFCSCCYHVFKDRNRRRNVTEVSNSASNTLVDIVVVVVVVIVFFCSFSRAGSRVCLLYTSDAADE